MPVVTLDDIATVVPEEFLSRVQKLWTTQKRELKKLLGKPPNFKNVKPAQWQKWKKDQEAALLILMMGYASTMLQAQIAGWSRRTPGEIPEEAINPEHIEREFIRNVRRRARFAAERIAATTRRRVSAGLRRNATADPEEPGQDAFNPDSVFSDPRSEMVARTEMTAARSATTRSIYDSMVANGVQCQLVWRMRPCDHCEICPILDGTPETFWRRFTSAPPIHPHCCCDLEILLGTAWSLITSGQMKRNPSIRGLRAAIQRSGFRL